MTVAEYYLFQFAYEHSYSVKETMEFIENGKNIINEGTELKIDKKAYDRKLHEKY